MFTNNYTSVLFLNQDELETAYCALSLTRKMWKCNQIYHFILKWNLETWTPEVQIDKVVSPYGASPYCLFPGCIVTWAWSLAKGQYIVSWLLTGTPEQRYWQNRETANVGLDSSVGRAPARQSGGRRFKSRSSNFVFVHPNLSGNYFNFLKAITHYW